MLARVRAAVTLRRASYFGIAFIAFVVATLVADVRAQIVFNGQPMGLAIREHLAGAAYVIGPAMLFAPFAVAAWWADRNDQARSFAARLIFASSIAFLVWYYWSAYQLVPGYLADRMWTAAALTIGLLPFYTLGYLVLFLAADWLVRAIMRNQRKRRG